MSETSNTRLHAFVTVHALRGLSPGPGTVRYPHRVTLTFGPRIIYMSSKWRGEEEKEEEEEEEQEEEEFRAFTPLLFPIRCGGTNFKSSPRLLGA